MINHIDVSSVLRRTVCDLYSNLVTRPTGAAVRTEIENLLSAWRGPSLTVIDFSHVNLLDFSCADEVVGKLRRRDTCRAVEDEGRADPGFRQHQLGLEQFELEAHRAQFLAEHQIQHAQPATLQRH